MCISWTGAPSLIPGLMNMSPETLKVGDTVSVQLTLQTKKPSLAATQSLLLGTLRSDRMRIYFEKH